MKISEVLDTAADLIEEKGWRKGSGWNMPGETFRGYCLEGAIAAAAGINVGDMSKGPFGGLWSCPAYRAVADYLGLNVTLERSANLFGEAPVQPLWVWNDRNGSRARVVAILRAASVVASAREAAAEREHAEVLS